MTSTSTAQDVLHSEIAALQSRVEELEQVERALRDDLHRAQHIAVTTPYLLCVHDLVERRNVYENRALTAELGYAGEEASRLGAGPLTALLHPDDLARASEHLARIAGAGDGDFVEMTCRLRSADGSFRWFLVRDTILLRDGASVPRQVTRTLEDVTARKRAEEEQERQAGELTVAKRLVDSALDGITVVSMSGVVLYGNPAFRKLSGYGDAVTGMVLSDFYTPENYARLSEQVIPPLLQDGHWSGVLTIRRPDGSHWMGQTSAFVISDGAGVPTGMAALYRDITAQLETEKERANLQAQMFAAQQATLRELGTPLIPIADEVIAMPLIGAIDSTRARQILETLLDGITTRGASVAILDITGVKVVDAQIAHALILTAHAARLLGTEVVLTGIDAKIAQELVDNGIDLHGIVTLSNLQRGIAYALSRAGRQRRSHTADARERRL